VFSERGIGGIFSGWGWRVTRMIAQTFIIANLKEVLAPALFSDVGL
jgi:hypothetical protein